MPGNEYADGMIEHDGDVGKLLKALDDLGIADNTIVIYTTDNGPNQFSWPDAATTPFRSEKDSNWEGAFRVPAMIRWPGKIKAGRGLQRDGLRARLVPDAARRRRRYRRSRTACSKAGSPSGSDHLQEPSRWLQPARLSDGQEPRRARAPTSTTSTMTAISSPCATTTGSSSSASSALRAASPVWSNPFTTLRLPKLFNLRMDPYERADIVSDQYYDWLVKNDYIILAAC